MAKPPPPPFFILQGHEGTVSTLHFNNEIDDIIEIKPTLLSGSDIGEIFIWGFQSFRTLFRLSHPEKKTIMFLKYYKSKLLSQSKDGILNIWIYNNCNWSITKKFLSECVGFCSSVFWLTKNGAHVASYNQEKFLNIYDVEKVEQIKEIAIKPSAGLCMCLKIVTMSAKWFLLMGYENGDIALWDCETDKEICSKSFHKDIVLCIDFDFQYRMRGISGSSDEFLLVWKITDDFQLEKVHELKLINPGISDIKIRNDGKIVVTAGWDFKIRVFSWKSLKPLAVLDFHTESVQCLACTPLSVDKRTSVFASGSKDKKIALWSIY